MIDAPKNACALGGSAHLANLALNIDLVVFNNVLLDLGHTIVILII